MFSSDTADRTLPPTERRRREARTRGDVVRSPELVSAVCLLAASSVFWWLGPAWGTELARLMHRALVTGPTFPTISVLVRQIGDVLAAILIPLATVVVLCAGMANLVQGGWVWNAASLVPRLRLRSVVSFERAGDMAWVLARLILLLVVTWLFFRIRNPQFHFLGLGEPVTFVKSMFRLVGELSIQLSTSLVILALADYAYRFWRHEQRLKMTVEELRREQYDDEVDPEIKRRQAALHR